MPTPLEDSVQNSSDYQMEEYDDALARAAKLSEIACHASQDRLGSEAQSWLNAAKSHRIAGEAHLLACGKAVERANELIAGLRSLDSGIGDPGDD